MLYVCVDHGTCYKFYLKKLKNNNSAHLSYTKYSLNTNILNNFLVQKTDEENQINEKLKVN